MSAPDPAVLLADTLSRIGPLDGAAMEAAQRRLDRLTKPPGSLGRLEELVVTLAGITGRPDPAVARLHVVVAAADHGVAAHGVSAYPSQVTAQMVANFMRGEAAVNVLAQAVGAVVTVVDVGVAFPVDTSGLAAMGGARLVSARVRDGTADMTLGPAMTRHQALRAVALGIHVVDDLLADGLDVLAVGEMGIGNTTAATAVTSLLTAEPVTNIAGRGTGVDDRGYARKIKAVERAIAVNRPDPADPIGVLAGVGGLEIATLVGLLVGAAANRIPVILDGFITGAAALVGTGLRAALAPRLIAAHRSPEPGHAIVLDRLGLRPYLDLDLRLGEGTGALLAMGLLVAACRARDEMATFEGAGISGASPRDG